MVQPAPRSAEEVGASVESKGRKATDAKAFLEPHTDKFMAALDRAREAEVTTSTPAWSGNYMAQVRSHKDAVRRYANAIAEAVETIKTSDTDEDAEKGIKDNVKAMQEERIEYWAWRNRAVAPFERAVDDCRQIGQKALQAAQTAERDQPLIYNGLGDRVKTILKGWPVASWDEETGRVTVNG